MKRKYIPDKIALVIVIIIVVSILLTLTAAGFVEGFIWLAGILGLQHSLGIDTQMSKNYDSVSGYLPMIVTSLGFSGLLVTVWHHLNCHQIGCPKIARYPIAGGKYKTCKEHNPDPKVREGITAKHLADAHQQYESHLKS